MAIPATRTMAGSNPNRRSQVLEINAGIPSPPRPTSARSVKAFPRPVTAGSTKGIYGTSLLHSHSQHRHAHTRSHHRLSGVPIADERAPFHRNIVDEKRQQKLLPAFHADNILDPDLAPYMMSDGDASDDEQMSVFATIAPPKLLETPVPPSGTDSGVPSTPASNTKGFDKLSGGGSARVRRPRSKSRGSISGLGAILTGGESPSLGGVDKSKRVTRRRGSSFIAPLQRPVTRGKSRGLMRSLAETVGGQSNVPTTGAPVTASPRASRSASMRGPPPTNVELNSASLEHIKKLLKQLLNDAEIPNVEKWEKALIPILLKCTDDINPDVRGGDDIDIRHYVKVKRIPGGSIADISYISGVVFTKNLALKSMQRHIPQPRILILTFPIEYSRHQQQLMSLEPVIAQEKEFLQNMVNRIVALRPNLLLVEKNVSGYALSLLAQANVATAYLVKPSVIEAVARCAEADIFSSIDKLALTNFRLGRCQRFDVKTFVHDDIPGRKKTFMYLSGCRKELGCTIVLRGADMNTLAVIKQITELMVYVVYNLKLETCLMRDEFVVIPSSPTGPVASPPTTRTPTVLPPETPLPVVEFLLGSSAKKDNSGETATKAESDREQKTDSAEDAAFNSARETEGDKRDGIPQEERKETSGMAMTTTTMSRVALSDDRLPDDIPHPTYYEDMVRKHETKILSASPFVSYMQPYLLTRARELERKLAYLRRLRDSLIIEEDDDGEDSGAESVDPEKLEEIDPEKAAMLDKPKPDENFVLVDPEAVHGESNVKASKKAKEVLKAIYDAEYDKALHVYETQKKQWENYLAQYDDLFDPFAHQSITILYSMVCTVTTVPCEGPEIRRLEFYYQDSDWEMGRSDCTLGQYIEYLCVTADMTCDAVSCDRKMIQHHRSYVHGQARVSVLVSDQIACPIKGMQNTILMWSYCKKCVNTNTPAIPMSESSWKYSFGKYLELAFWSSEMRIRDSNCPHDINRDHVRCFGYRGLTVLFQHDPIDLLEIVVPRTRITYKPEIDLRVKNEQYIQNETKIKAFFASVQARLKSINVESVPPEKIDACRAEIEFLMARAREDEDWLIAKLQEKYNKSKYYEIIPLNRALRALQEKVVEWDTKFNAFDNQYFPSEKDIRRLATLQLKKIFLDNTSTPLHSDHEPAPTQEKDEGAKTASIDGANTSDTSAPNSPVPFSSEQAHDVLASVVEEEQEKDKDKGEASGGQEQTETASMLDVTADVPPTSGPGTSDEEQHLDKAIPASDAEQQIPQDTASHSVSQPSTPSILVEGEQPKTLSTVESSESESPTPSMTKRSSLPDSSRMISAQVSAIPRLDTSRRRPPPSFSRTVSVPEVPRRKDLAGPASAGLGRRSPTIPTLKNKPSIIGKTTEKIRNEKKLDKFRLSSLANKPKAKEPSQIPRSVPTLHMNTMQMGLKRPITQTAKVSSLAKHFEQLSKEFERERARERRQLAAKRARALPVATSRPIVEVYKNVDDAVEEGSDEEQAMNLLNAVEEGSDEEQPADQPLAEPDMETAGGTTIPGSKLKAVSPVLSPEQSTSPGTDTASQLGTTPDMFVHPPPLGQSHSDADASDGEMSMTSDQDTLSALPSISDTLPQSATDTDVENNGLDLKLGLPQQHRWMKMLSNFWAERSASGWTSLDYPLHPTDHVFNDSDIIVREDEPSSLIAFTLDCSDYRQKLNDIRNSDYSHIGSERPTSSEEQVHRHSFNLQEHPELERSLLKTTGTHLKYQFQEGTAKMFCKIFYAEQFDALRRNCGIADRYVESLSRCIKWDSKGGKTGSVFLKTQDERIVLKSLRPVETAAFVKFAPAYFQFMSEAFFHEVGFRMTREMGGTIAD
jgi:1-phosphatidylinositol-3-phosphate 5-kinase